MRPHSFALPFSLVTVVAACASSGSTTSSSNAPRVGGQVQETRVATPKGDITVSMMSDGAVPAEPVPASVEKTYRAVAAAYAKLGLQITIADSVQHRIGVRAQPIRRTLGGERLSNFLECGTSAFAMKNADNYTIRLSALTTVVANGTDSFVQTVIDANAASEGSSEARVRCGTSGRLEHKIAALAASEAH